MKVIAAEGEQKASRALREASDVITESAAALQLRYLQVVSFEAHVLMIIYNIRCSVFMMIINLKTF